MNDLIKVMNKTKPDTVPVVSTAGDIAAKLIGITRGEARTNANLLAEMSINFQKQVGMDWLLVYCDSFYAFEALGCKVEISNGDPFLAKKFGDEEFEEFPRAGFSETPSCKALFDAVEIAKQTTNNIPLAAVFDGPFTSSMRINDAAKIMKMLIREPKKVEPFLESMAGVLCELVDRLMEKGINVFFIPEPFSSSSAISIKHFNQYAKPYISKLIKHIKDKKGYAMLHVCGATNDRWLELASTEPSALSLDQVVDMSAAREVVGPDFVLAGNVDPIHVLREGKVEQVVAASEKAIRDAGPYSFILMPGCGVPRTSPLENIQAMVSTGKNHQIK